LDKLEFIEIDQKKKPLQNQLFETTIQSLQLAQDLFTPLNFHVPTITIFNQNDKVDKDYVLAYAFREAHIRTIPISTMASKAIAILQINFYLNKAQQLVQEAMQDKQKVELSTYLKLYATVIDKESAEQMPEKRPYNYAINLKVNFIP
jgi:50S ribosomal subunit-associated GTPase HflX